MLSIREHDCQCVSDEPVRPNFPIPLVSLARRNAVCMYVCVGVFACCLGFISMQYVQVAAANVSGAGPFLKEKKRRAYKWMRFRSDNTHTEVEDETKTRYL